ncbi:hypothetical protein [uncultured Draconibacterium sp.]|uniref:hypothetical protein n=1 Tax=uncultured Draconibacterium sp. TaxID=1573823 RepID=UPI0032166C51
MKGLLILLIAVLFFACSTQRKIQKTYIGQPVSVMEKKFGEAKILFKKSAEEEYIFEKKEYLKSTEISQHKLTLDPMITPQVTKISMYHVTVVDGIITKIEIEEEYER